MNRIPYNFIDSVADVLVRKDLKKLRKLSHYYGRIAENVLTRRISTVHAEFYVSKGNVFERNSVNFTRSGVAGEVSWHRWTSEKCRNLSVDMCTLAVHEANFADSGDSSNVDVFAIARSARRVFLKVFLSPGLKEIDTRQFLGTLQKEGIGLHGLMIETCDDAGPPGTDFTEFAGLIGTLVKSPCAPRDITVSESLFGGSPFSSKLIVDFFRMERASMVNLSHAKGRPQNVLKAWRESASPFHGKLLVVDEMRGTAILEDFRSTTGNAITYQSSPESPQYSCADLYVLDHPTDSRRKTFAFPFHKEGSPDRSESTRKGEEHSNSIIFYFT